MSDTKPPKPTKPPKIEKPKAEGDKRRKGKKNLNWKEDPEILQRLSKVAELMVQHKIALVIAQETKVSLGTVKRDIARVRELWKEDAKDRVLNAKDLAIAQYGAVLEKSWADAAALPVTHPNRPAVLNIMLRAQERIDKVTGIADKVEHSGPDGGPIPMEVTNMDEVRKKRWKQIAPNLAELVTQETDATQSTTAKKS